MNHVANEREIVLVSHSKKIVSFGSAIRQRFNLQADQNCCFDLPALRYWLHLSPEKNRKIPTKWIEHIKAIVRCTDLFGSN